jgi:hypothetical protein
MTKEEFKTRLELDESLRRCFESNPIKVIQQNKVELSVKEMKMLSHSLSMPTPGAGFGPKKNWF